MESNNAWRDLFFVTPNSRGEWLVVERGKQFSHNMVLYKTEAGAKKGAQAAYDKIMKEFEEIFLLSK